MAVFIQYECEEEIPLLPCEELAARTAEKVLEEEGCDADVEISLVVTDEEAIREANREFRGIDRVTDVLSFPAVPFPSPSDFSILEEDETLFDLDTGRLMLGDIMICAGKVRSQAEEYGHSLQREFCFLVAHSMLHLLGYDHMESSDAFLMEERQRKIMDALGITR